jgi:glucosamine--fructose-6-phosphate aminotransferase (isomerizing)
MRLRAEIFEQPLVLTRLLESETHGVREIASAVRARRVQYVLIAARGTSDNAARYGQYLLGAQNRLPVGLATPSLFSVYKQSPRLDQGLVVGISQSGRSPDIVAVLAEARQQGAPTLAVTNDPGSPLADEAEFVIPLHAGEEQAVAATKTYTAQLAALAMLSCTLDDDDSRLEALRQVPGMVQQVLDGHEQIAPAVERYRYMESCVVLGRGYNYATAFEIALKLKELTYIVAEPYSSADFRHGPVAIVERGFPAVVVAPQGAVYPDMLALARELAAPGRAAELIVISEEDEPLGLARTPLRLPVALPEWLSPFTCVVPGQLLALHVTLAKGYDPDHPRGLKKVTETR